MKIIHLNKGKVRLFKHAHLLTVIFGFIFWRECITGTAYERVFPIRKQKSIKKSQQNSCKKIV